MLEGSTPYRSALYITSLGNGEQKAVWTWRLRGPGGCVQQGGWLLFCTSLGNCLGLQPTEPASCVQAVTDIRERKWQHAQCYSIAKSLPEWSVPSQRWEVWSHRQKPGSCSDPQVWLSAWKSPESTWPSQGSPPCPEHWSCVREVQREGRLESPEPFPRIIYLISLHAKHRCEGKPSQHTEHPKCYLQMMFQEEN